MKFLLITVVLCFAIKPFSFAMDCRKSKEFTLTHTQKLSGAIEDPSGAVIPGMEMELVSAKKIVRSLRTNNLGQYDFGEVQAGKYRLRLKDGTKTFCAPKIDCQQGDCRIKSKVTVNPKSAVLVY